jgi:hypothetical protein
MSQASPNCAACLPGSLRDSRKFACFRLNNSCEKRPIESISCFQGDYFGKLRCFQLIKYKKYIMPSFGLKKHSFVTGKHCFSTLEALFLGENILAIFLNHGRSNSYL